jgi:hypothetical protein
MRCSHPCCSNCCAIGTVSAGPQGWLFPGRDPVSPMTTRQLTRACHAAADMAEIKKRRRTLPSRRSRLVQSRPCRFPAGRLRDNLCTTSTRWAISTSVCILRTTVDGGRACVRFLPGCLSAFPFSHFPGRVSCCSDSSSAPSCESWIMAMLDATGRARPLVRCFYRRCRGRGAGKATHAANTPQMTTMPPMIKGK